MLSAKGYMASHSTVIQDLIPQLAASLGQLRRVPGKSDAWVGQVIVALEKERDPRFERMQRRIGFARRLGDMAAVHKDDVSLATLGIFFHELLPLKRSGLKVSRTWREYLLRNEDWLRPALDVCDAAHNQPWQDIEDPSAILAKTAILYDIETVDRHERPLVVVESIIAEVESHEAQRIAGLLWTEDGQALCDHHFRSHPRAYQLDPKAIRAALAGLYRFTPRNTGGVPVQSMRAGTVENFLEQETEVEQPVPQTTTEQEAVDHFDRRRQALRAKREVDQVEGAEQTITQDRTAREAESPSGIEAKLREIEDAERAIESVQPIELAQEQPPTRTSELQPQYREERMNQLSPIPGSNHARGDALDVRDRLQELRLQLGQIQQIAAQAEQLLGGIAPQIDEFAARIADVEAVMDRWNGRTRAAA